MYATSKAILVGEEMGDGNQIRYFGPTKTFLRYVCDESSPCGWHGSWTTYTIASCQGSICPPPSSSGPLDREMRMTLDTFLNTSTHIHLRCRRSSWPRFTSCGSTFASCMRLDDTAHALSGLPLSFAFVPALLPEVPAV